MKAKTLNAEIEVEVSSIASQRPCVGKYCVYDGKIWYATSASGAGNSYRITIERVCNVPGLIFRECETLKGFTEELKSAKLLISPTGFIGSVYN